MNISIKSNDYEVIGNGIVIAYGQDSDITFHFNDGKGYIFDLKFVFKYDDSKNMVINRSSLGNTILYECYNFYNEGTGSSEPIKVAPYHEQNIYIRFWTSLDGNISEQGKTRKLEYTFFLGK